MQNLDLQHLVALGGAALMALAALAVLIAIIRSASERCGGHMAACGGHMAANRIYVVGENGSPLALVSAISQAAAIKHATANRFSASVATQQELVQLLGDGMKVEVAGETAGATAA